MASSWKRILQQLRVKLAGSSPKGTQAVLLDAGLTGPQAAIYQSNHGLATFEDGPESVEVDSPMTILQDILAEMGRIGADEKNNPLKPGGRALENACAMFVKVGQELDLEPHEMMAVDMHKAGRAGAVFYTYHPVCFQAACDVMGLPADMAKMERTDAGYTYCANPGVDFSSSSFVPDTPDDPER